MTKSLSKQAMQEMRIRLLGWEDPLEKEMATCSSLAWEIAWTHGQRSLVGHSPWGHKESDVTEHACTIMSNTDRYYYNLPRCILVLIIWVKSISRKPLKLV